MKISEGQEKRLVESYKSNNKQLRKQLQNLNNEIDRILAAKINRIGLKKMPHLQKGIEQTTDIKVLQIEVDNLRKRLELLHHDNQNLKVRATVDHMTKAKELEEKLATKKLQKEQLKKEVYVIDKNSMSLNTTDLQNQEFKLYDKIQQVNQQLIRTKKMQADLEKQMAQKQQKQQKEADFVQRAQEHHARAAQQAEKVMKSRIEVPVTHGNQNDQEWRLLKKQFLDLKESKLWEQTALKQQNDRLRTDIRQLELKLKQKKYKMQNIRSLEVRRKERNYSTLQHQAPKGNDPNYRYRNRNSYKYNTKN